MDNLKTINLDLSDLFSDHRKSCYLSIDERFETVGDVERYLKSGFKIIEPFYLEAAGVWLPSFERTALILAVSDQVRLKLVKPQSKTEFRTDSCEEKHEKQKKKKRKHDPQSDTNESHSIENNVEENSFNESYMKKKKKKKESNSGHGTCESSTIDGDEKPKTKKKKKNKDRDYGFDGVEQVEIPTLPDVAPTLSAETPIETLAASPANTLDNTKSSTDFNEGTTTKRRRFRTRRKKSAKKEEECNDYLLSKAKEQAMAVLNSTFKSFNSYQNQVPSKRKHIRFDDEEIVSTESTDESAQPSQLIASTNCSAETGSSVIRNSRNKVEVYEKNTISDYSNESRINKPATDTRSVESFSEDMAGTSCGNENGMDVVMNEKVDIDSSNNSISLSEVLENLKEKAAKASQLIKSNSSRYKVQIFERKPRIFPGDAKTIDSVESLRLSSENKDDQITDNRMDVCRNDTDDVELQKTASVKKKEDNGKDSEEDERIVCANEMDNMICPDVLDEIHENERNIVENETNRRNSDVEDGVIGNNTKAVYEERGSNSEMFKVIKANGSDSKINGQENGKNKKNSDKESEANETNTKINDKESRNNKKVDDKKHERNTEMGRVNEVNGSSKSNDIMESRANETNTKINDKENGKNEKMNGKEHGTNTEIGKVNEVNGSLKSNDIMESRANETNSKSNDKETVSNTKISDKENGSIKNIEIKENGADERTTMDRDTNLESLNEENTSAKRVLVPVLSKLDNTPSTNAAKTGSAVSKPKFGFSVGDLVSFQVMYIDKYTTPVVTDEIVGKIIYKRNHLHIKVLSGTVKLGAEKCRFSDDEDNLRVYPTGSVALLYPEDMINSKKVEETYLTKQD